jgi:hypothetical protein
MTDLTKKRRLLVRNGWYVLLKTKSVKQTAREMQLWKNYKLKWSTSNHVFWSLWKPPIPPSPPPKQNFQRRWKWHHQWSQQVIQGDCGGGGERSCTRMCPQNAGCWWIQCVVSALQVLHVSRAMIFPCKKKCHEFCFEANCERTVVSRNLMDKTVVLMSNSNMWIGISRSTRGRVDTVSQMLEMVAWNYSNYCHFPDACSYPTYRALLPDAAGRNALFPFFEINSVTQNVFSRISVAAVIL